MKVKFIDKIKNWQKGGPCMRLKLSYTNIRDQNFDPDASRP